MCGAYQPHESFPEAKGTAAGQRRPLSSLLSIPVARTEDVRCYQITLKRTCRRVVVVCCFCRVVHCCNLKGTGLPHASTAIQSRDEALYVRRTFLSHFSHCCTPWSVNHTHTDGGRTYCPHLFVICLQLSSTTHRHIHKHA